MNGTVPSRAEAGAEVVGREATKDQPAIASPGSEN